MTKEYLKNLSDEMSKIAIDAVAQHEPICRSKVENKELITRSWIDFCYKIVQKNKTDTFKQKFAEDLIDLLLIGEELEPLELIKYVFRQKRPLEIQEVNHRNIIYAFFNMESPNCVDRDSIFREERRDRKDIYKTFGEDLYKAEEETKTRRAKEVIEFSRSGIGPTGSVSCCDAATLESQDSFEERVFNI